MVFGIEKGLWQKSRKSKSLIWKNTHKIQKFLQRFIHLLLEATVVYFHTAQTSQAKLWEPL